MKRILNERLQTLSAFINNGDVVLDIGCDHGLLGIYLTLNKDNVRVVSSDINIKPLEKAKENISKYKLDDKIETRLGDGLSTMSIDINTIVISGMGGINIVNILKDIKKYPNVKKIILSPNSDFSLVRKKICQLGFKIVKEEIVKEQGKYYLISQYELGYQKMDYYFGKLDLSNNIVKDYYQYIYKRNIDILNKLNVINKIKRYSLIKENRKIKKKILCHK